MTFLWTINPRRNRLKSSFIIQGWWLFPMTFLWTTNLRRNRLKSSFIIQGWWLFPMTFLWTINPRRNRLKSSFIIQGWWLFPMIFLWTTYLRRNRLKSNFIIQGRWLSPMTYLSTINPRRNRLQSIYILQGWWIFPTIFLWTTNPKTNRLKSSFIDRIITWTWWLSRRSLMKLLGWWLGPVNKIHNWTERHLTDLGPGGSIWIWAVGIWGRLLPMCMRLLFVGTDNSGGFNWRSLFFGLDGTMRHRCLQHGFILKILEGFWCGIHSNRIHVMRNDLICFIEEGLFCLDNGHQTDGIWNYIFQRGKSSIVPGGLFGENMYSWKNNLFFYLKWHGTKSACQKIVTFHRVIL